MAKGGVNLVNGGTISGATSSSLSLTNITTADAANFRVVVSGAALLLGSYFKYFGPLVNQIIAIGTQPATTQSVCSGTSAV
jgi:hypothetical protein